MFVPEYGFTLSEHDTERSWLVLSVEHRTVELPDDVSFYEWSRETWPPPRWRVEPDPWQFGPTLWPR
jgi:hypothetical protein